MDGKVNQSVFNIILYPLMCLLQRAAINMPEDEKKYKLSLLPFTLNLMFGIINDIKSVSLIITTIKSSVNDEVLKLIDASKSMYSEAFSRYDSGLFKEIFLQLLENIDFLRIPEVQNLGRILIIDGSHFPAIISMTWASYKKKCNSIKLHLSFELNRMIPVQFFSGSGNFSEKSFLSGIIEKGVTYICDRGYFKTKLFKQIIEAGAFFIIRGKSKMKYDIIKQLAVNIPNEFLEFLQNIRDMKINLVNDKTKTEFRLITFYAKDEYYYLITNRFDLTTYQVIMLYAYRWQVELIFRFLKRTLGAIHLMSHSENGVQIQFYLYMISYLLLLSFKQECSIKKETDQKNKESNKGNKKPSTLPNLQNSGREYVCGLVSLLGDRLKKYWKIGIHWLTTLREILFEPFSPKTIEKLG